MEKTIRPRLTARYDRFQIHKRQRESRLIEHLVAAD